MLVRFVDREELEASVRLTRPNRAEINLDYMDFNVREINSHLDKYCSSPSLLPIIKADAYGHGALVMTAHMFSNSCDYRNTIAGVSVATLEEAIVLRKQLKQLGVSCPLIHLLGMLPMGAESIAMEYDIVPSVGNFASLQRCIEQGKISGNPMKIHIKLDSGMHRTGFLYHELEELMCILKESIGSNYINLDGIYTHLAQSEVTNKEYSMLQLGEFERMLKVFKDNEVSAKYIHCMNSGGCIDFPLFLKEYEYLKDMNLFRYGIMFYGFYPSDEVQRSFVQLKSVMKWETVIEKVKILEENDIAEFGGFIAKERTTIAEIPVGYADGYRRVLSEKDGKQGYHVEILGKLCPILGNVDMDITTIDISCFESIPKIGTAVSLIEEDNRGLESPVHCDVISEWYYWEMPTCIGERVPRLYYRNNILVAVRTLHETLIINDFFD